MGFFGKSKQEKEAELKFEKKYGITKLTAECICDSLAHNLGTTNLDAVVKYRAPSIHKIICEVYMDAIYNKKKLDELDAKYSELISAVNRQNELLEQLVLSNHKAS